MAESEEELRGLLLLLSCSVVSDSVRLHRRQSTRLLRPWDFPGKGTECGAIAYSEELRSLLIKVKEESEKAGLNVNFQKTKVMASGLITSWK